MNYSTLPLILKIKYEELNNLIGVYFDNPEEYRVNNNQYLLVINESTIMEQFGDTIINTHGKLRILYNSKFQITHYEFTSFKHEEIQSGKEGSDSTSIVNEFGITPQLSRSLIVSNLFLYFLYNISLLLNRLLKP